jgi:hypothetical protein
VQNLEDLFHFLIGKSAQIFCIFPKIFNCGVFGRISDFSHGKSDGYFKFSNEFFRLQKARKTLTFFWFFNVVNLLENLQFFNEFPTNFPSGIGCGLL